MRSEFHQTHPCVTKVVIISKSLCRMFKSLDTQLYGMLLLTAIPWWTLLPKSHPIQTNSILEVLLNRKWEWKIVHYKSWNNFCIIIDSFLYVFLLSSENIFNKWNEFHLDISQDSFHILFFYFRHFLHKAHSECFILMGSTNIET